MPDRNTPARPPEERDTHTRRGSTLMPSGNVGTSQIKQITGTNPVTCSHFQDYVGRSDVVVQGLENSRKLSTVCQIVLSASK